MEYDILINPVDIHGNFFPESLRSSFPYTYTVYKEEVQKRKIGLGDNQYVRENGKVIVNAFIMHGYGGGMHIDLGGLGLSIEKLKTKLSISREDLMIVVPEEIAEYLDDIKQKIVPLYPNWQRKRI